MERDIEIERRLTETEQRSKSNCHRLEECEDAIKENNKLIRAIENLAAEMKYMRAELNTTIARLDKMESKDMVAKSKGPEKWEKIKWHILTGIVTIILGYLAAVIGLK